MTRAPVPPSQFQQGFCFILIYLFRSLYLGINQQQLSHNMAFIPPGPRPLRCPPSFLPSRPPPIPLNRPPIAGFFNAPNPIDATGRWPPMGPPSYTPLPPSMSEG